MSRPVTLDEALALLHVEPAIPESDDARERVPHATWQGEPYALEYVRPTLSACTQSTTQRFRERQSGHIEIGVDPDGRRRITGTCSISSPFGSSVRVYRFDARPFTEAELVAGVFALLGGDRVRAVDPTVLDGDATRVIRIRAESHCDGWHVSVWGLALGHAAKHLWWAKGTTFTDAADNLRAILSATYGVPND